MKAIQIILSLVVLIGVLYFWGRLAGRIYYDPLCKRHGDALGYSYTGFHPDTLRTSPKCYYLDANGRSQQVYTGEIQRNFLDYLRGAVYYVTYIVGVVGVVVIARKILKKAD